MPTYICSGFTDSFWLYVAEHLAENDYYPVYWIGSSKFEEAIKEKYPGTIFHSIIDAVKGIRPVENADRVLKPLDTALLDDWAVCQIALLRMMNRIDALGSFGYSDRVRLLHKLMRYWQTILDDLKPDVVIFSVIPHMVFDYVLYEYCVRKDIKTLMFESTPMRGMSFVMERFDGASRIEKLYQRLLQEDKLKTILLSPEMEDYLQSFQGSYQEVPDYIRRDYKQNPYDGLKTPQKSFLRKIIDFNNYSHYIKKQIRITQSRFTAPDNYFKQRDKKLENSSMSWLQHSFFLVGAHRKMRRLIHHYQQLANDADYNKKYIYVALSFQPERTTSPMASYYVDQSLIVDLIAKTIPENWLVYVKEHPVQFAPSKFYRAQSGRSFDFYDDLVSIPKVHLISMETDSYELIDNAQAVATPTGTVGWEAVNRGVPAMVFGFPWYRGCEGVFSVDTFGSCVNAIEQIRNGYKIDRDKLRLFAYATEQLAITATVERHLRIEDYSDRENAARLADALLGLL
jgi:hypothetical protein